jgi:predicted  nucleic acid-binding Zn-ribbon protein
MSRSQVLHRLQTLDSETEVIIQRLRAIEASLVESDELQTIRQQVARLESELARWRARQKDLDLEVRSLTEKIVTEEKQLYSGRVTNPKQLSHLQEEVASLKRRKNEVEDYLLEAMVTVDETQEKLAIQQEHMVVIGGAWEQEQAALRKEKENLQGRLEILKAERANLSQTIPPADLALYGDLRRRKGGRAVALLQGDICQGCGVTLPTSEVQQARSGRTLSLCSSCGRILHVTS